MDLSIIIVNYNSSAYLTSCINSFKKSLKRISYEFLVVDNASKLSEIKKLNSLTDQVNTRVLRNKKNLGFGYANNIGLKKANGNYILFLNPDTIAGNIKFTEIINWMNQNPNVGAMTCQLRNEDGTIQGTGGYFPTLLRVFSWMFFVDDLPIIDKFISSFHPHHPRTKKPNDVFYRKIREVDWITGAFYLARHSILGDGFDEDYFMYTEDVDLSYRIKKAGYKLFYIPKWNVIHLGGKSSNSEYPIITELKGLTIYYKKHMPAYQLPILRFVLKSGVILRRFIFSAKGDHSLSKIYEEAFTKI